jgi:RNA polymerase sigma-70 factor (ECF subfamily)
MQITLHGSTPVSGTLQGKLPLIIMEHAFAEATRTGGAIPAIEPVKKGRAASGTRHMAKGESFFSTQLLAYVPRLRAYALSLSHHHDRADDLVQETLFKALRYQEQFVPGSNLIGWLTVILRNEHYTMLRKRREVEDVDDIFSARLSVPGGQFESIELTETMSVIRTLPKGQRSAVLLVAALGFTCQEAADRCATKVGTIKSRLNRGRATLRRKAELDAGPQWNEWNGCLPGPLSNIATDRGI